MTDFNLGDSAVNEQKMLEMLRWHGIIQKDIDSASDFRTGGEIPRKNNPDELE